MNRTLVKKLDKTFSELVRKSETPTSYGHCVSCGAYKPYSELDAGHFINRGSHSVRWHRDNVHIQCRSCNRFQEGNAVGYTLYMIDRYGREYVEYLQGLSKQTAHFTDSEGELMLAEMKRELNGLKDKQ